MQSWIQGIFDSDVLTWLMIPAAFAAGIITAVTACCNYPVLGAIAGYCVAGKQRRKGTSVVICAGFLASTIMILAVAVSIASYVQAIAVYGQIIAGLVIVFMGLLVLGLVPFRMPGLKLLIGDGSENTFSPAIFGLVTGLVASAATFSCCAPLLWLILGAAVVTAKPSLALIVAGMFAVGFTIPAVAVSYGAGVGKFAPKSGSAQKVLRVAGGVVLVIAGFWLLFSARN